VNYELDENPSAEAMSRILDGVRGYNQSVVHLSRPRPLAVFLRDDTSNIVGGVRGDLWGPSMHVAALWVDETHRRHGHGAILLHKLEEKAITLGIRLAYLETLSFQARPFYERQGYRLFGELPEIADGCTLFFLRKDLPGSART
jgi:GNAT superfamily N-acetyltransferase